ncbi:MAG: DUF1192 domain-containing protein [Hellea sp.]|nr:DUF1192 domain-containing protein [Hellea sp.]
MTENNTAILIGEDLYGISIDELAGRIAILNDEIARIEKEMDKKTRERSAADDIFGKKS